ncbi:AAA family ATPase [Pantoea cypripedii]|uniref:ATPase n=1 Tax=Pantoea cypripedii TaxID=55209 RepID=A0A1X1EQH8_PANCY|nr:ATP-binding protein [Pantoea cypripedii]MBP2196165.1 putative ATPase [Pantoea cypripedii]ORM92123.1 ATPase [Pantoea cypripedii]
MLTQIHIENFKSYKKQTLHLAPLTLMIGANASGKSNALEAFRFLCWLGQGQKLSVLKYRVEDSEEILRGKISDLGYLSSPQFEIGCSTDDDDWNFFEVEIAVRDSELHIIHETILSPDKKRPLYRIMKPSEGASTLIKVAYNNFSTHGRMPLVNCTDNMLVMSQLASSAIFESGHKKAQKTLPEITEKFQTLLENTLFLDPVPSSMRGDSAPDKKLRGNCANLSGVLYILCQYDELKSSIIDFIKSLPEQDVKDITFFRDRRGQVSLELVESFGGKERTWSVDLLSDGTLRVLAIAAALLSVPEGSTVVIEEVDNGVHPSRARQLLETMRKQASLRGVRLLLSTHNPALMDALPDEALGDVVFCYRDAKAGDSCLVRLADLDDFPGLITQGPLGELVTNGVVDRFVKTASSSEERKQKAMAWLESFQGEKK